MGINKELIKLLLEIKNDSNSIVFDENKTKLASQLEQYRLVNITRVHGLSCPWTCMITNKGLSVLQKEGLI